MFPLHSLEVGGDLSDFKLLLIVCITCPEA